jgi:hypothetical protein
MLRQLSSLIVAATVASGCGVAKTSDQQEKEALEKRVAELEARLAEKDAAQVEPAPVVESLPAATPAPAVRNDRPVRVVPPVRQKPEPAYVPTPVPVDSAMETASVPAPTPRPAAVTTRPVQSETPPLLIPQGTTLEMTLENAVSSKTSAIGDRVTAHIDSAVDADGAVTLPGGSYLEGRIVDVKDSGRVKGKARVDIAFDQIFVRSKPYDIDTTNLTFEADDSHKKDAAIVAGSAVAGALLGKITGGSAGKGAVIGGVAGGGAVLATKGKDVELPAGTKLSVQVSRDRMINR